MQAAFTATARDLESRAPPGRRIRASGRISKSSGRTRCCRLRSRKPNQRYLLPNFDVAEQVYTGVRALLTDQVAKERHPAAVVRLRRYAGLEEGYTPLAVLAEARVREQLGTIGLLFPYKGELEQQLANSTLYLDGVAGTARPVQGARTATRR